MLLLLLLLDLLSKLTVIQQRMTLSNVPVLYVIHSIGAVRRVREQGGHRARPDLTRYTLVRHLNSGPGSGRLVTESGKRPGWGEVR